MYTSTRSHKEKTASLAIIEGLSKDGGLYVLDNIPKIDIKKLNLLSYKKIAEVIFNLFLDDFDEKEITKCINEAYIDNFDTEDVVKMHKTNDSFYLELYHGPTLAFKDVALTILPKFLEVAKIKNNINSKTVILTATSGDTGSAALSGFTKIKNTDTLVFYPYNGVSKTQEQQMLSFNGDNAKSIAIRGNFDDCQNFVKKEFLKHKNLSSANSINIGRLLPQIVYYFYSYFKMVNDNEIKMDEKINFCVPTGNFGDILAGFYAYKMGLPVNKLICASNQNKVLFDFFKTGLYDKRRTFYKTSSPSMDILISSNLERLIYHIVKDPVKVNDLMNQLAKKGHYKIPIDHQLDIFSSGWASDIEAKEIIKKIFTNDKYLIDPHTAVAKCVYEKYKKASNDNTKTIILSTASPYKFARSIGDSLGLSDDDEFVLIKKISEYTNTSIPKQIMKLQKNIKDNHIMTMNEADCYLEERLK